MTYTLGVSHAPRWMVCHAAPRLSAEAPKLDVTGDDTSRREGLDAHWVAEQVLQSNGTTAPREYVGQVLPNGTLFTLDHAIAVGVYVQDVLSIAKHCSDPLLVENRNDMSWLAPGVVAILDTSVYDKTSRTITVWDFKFGPRGRDPFRCWQMIGNGLAAAIQYPDAERIELRVVQPNCYSDDPIKYWELDINDLKAFGLTMRHGATLAQSPEAQPVPGQHCRGCRAAHVCGALQEYNKRLNTRIEMSMQNNVTVQNMTPQEISLEMDMLAAAQQTIKARKEAQDVYAFQLSDKSGVSIPGYKLVSKRAHRRMTDASAFVNMARQCGYTDKLLYHEPKLLSPSQLENVGVDKELVEMFSEKPDNGKQLAPMSDNRPATASTLIEMFSNVRGDAAK